jgi:hypothetical protein
MGTVPRLQWLAVPSAAAVPPVHVFAVLFCAIVTGLVATAVKSARKIPRVAPKLGKVMNLSLWNRRLKKPAEDRRHLLKGEVW